MILVEGPTDGYFYRAFIDKKRTETKDLDDVDILNVQGKTNFEWTYNEKKGSFVIETLGPATSEEVYDIPFTAENVQALYDKAEGEEVQFVLKDMQTGDAKSVNWSSVKDSLDLFCNKSFDYLWKADYIPAPVKAEYRQEAVAQGLIHGVQSDYAAPTSSAGKGGAYT